MESITLPGIYKIIDIIFELGIITISLYSVKIFIERNKKEPNKMKKYTIYLYISLALAAFFQMMDGIFYSKTDLHILPLYDIQYGYALIIISTAITNVSLFYLGTEIFYSSQENIPKIILVSRKVILYVLIITTIIGGIMKVLDMNVTIVIGLYMVLSMSINLGLTINAFKIAAKVDEPLFKESLKNIGYFTLNFLFVFIFFILDSFYTGYSIFGVFGWGWFLFAVYLGYKGFTKPAKRIIIEEKKKLEALKEQELAEKAEQPGGEQKGGFAKLSKSYIIFIIIYFGLYEIFDSYNTSFYPSISSFIIADLFGNNVSFYYLSISVASIGLYVVFVVQFLMDVVGRKPILITVFFGMALSLILLGTASTVPQFTFYMFLLFIFFSSDVWVVIVLEEAPPDKRAIYSYLISFIGVVGVIIIPFMRTYLINALQPQTWRNMTLIGYIILPLAFLGFFVKETRAFIEKKKSRQLRQNWRKDIILIKLKKLFGKENGNIKRILVFIIIGIITGMNYASFQTIETFFRQYIANDTVSLIILVASLGSILVFATAGIIADKIGRKKLMIIFSSTLPLFLVLLIFATMQQNLAMIFIFVVLTQISFWGMYTLSKIYCAESFDTDIRGTASAWRAISYAFGLTIGSLILSNLTTGLSLGMSYISIGIWSLIIVPPLIHKYLKETKGINIATK
ncbi:MAG: MFS transporter [Promethearchaeota archaeon]